MKNRFLNNDEDMGRAFTYSGLQDRILRVRIQQSNKVIHRCLFCDNEIPVGNGSAYYSGVQAGKFYGYHQCLTCYSLYNEER